MPDERHRLGREAGHLNCSAEPPESCPYYQYQLKVRGINPETIKQEATMTDKFTDFQKRVEGVLDDIVEYYENGTDAADDVIQWAKDWAAQREIDWLEIKAGK